MAWLKTLAETYDTSEEQAGKVKTAQAVLLPISHSTFNAQIEAVIASNGDFVSARKLEKGIDAVTVIPVTEDSASRSSGVAPHPLCEKLCYIAGDYTFYTGDDKGSYFQAYMLQLQDWAESEYTHPFVQAMYRYLGKKSLIHDLVESHTLELDEQGRLTDKIKLHAQGQTGANVRFRVLGGEMPQEVWRNPELYTKYKEYYQHKLNEQKERLRLCYVTGMVVPCSDKHPSKIRNTADKAKLISGNDESGFTYRGRFTSKEQAVSVGYEVSQKAHNALRWLIQNQGYTRDESAIAAWMTNRNMQIPDLCSDSVNAYKDIDDFDFDFDSIGPGEASAMNKIDTGKYFAEQFNRAVNGYAAKIKADDKVAIIALDAATTGRLSVVYYEEMGGRQYIEAILNWQQHCKWIRSIKVGKSEGNRRKITCECTPPPRDMALAAFGVQRSEWLEADSKLLRTTVKRLLPCITQGARIPPDIIRAAARRASMPQTMSENVWYNDVLRVLCAMIRFEYEKGDTKMDDFLTDRINDRNVLFGRLLAVYDYMEQRAMFEYDSDGKVKSTRTTNAKRYWNAYSSRPAKTLKTIRQNLVAYEKKLSSYELKKFEEWTGEIMQHFSAQEYDNRALSEYYLPGYYLQMEYMKQAFQKRTKEGESEDE